MSSFATENTDKCFEIELDNFSEIVIIILYFFCYVYIFGRFVSVSLNIVC